MSGRTTWWSKDAAWWRRARVVELGQEHGPAGPAVMDWLTCEAKAQGPSRGHDGTVKSGYTAAAHGCFIAKADDARAIIATAVEVGLLDDFTESGRTFTCRISGWEDDIEKPLAATRKAAQRAAQTSGDKGGHSETEGSNVAHSPPTRQDKTTTPPAEGGRVVTFARRAVPAARLALAEKLLAEFNSRAGTSHAAFTGRGQASESLRRIIGALTDWPDVTEQQWKAAIAWSMTNPWWDGKPDTGVVFGPKVIAKALESSKDTKSGSGLERFREHTARLRADANPGVPA